MFIVRRKRMSLESKRKTIKFYFLPKVKNITTTIEHRNQIETYYVYFLSLI